MAKHQKFFEQQSVEPQCSSADAGGVNPENPGSAMSGEGSGESKAMKRKRHQSSSAAGFTRTREDHQRERAEDYVELIQELIAEHGEARTVDLAQRLGISHVTVSRTLNRLKKSGLIRTEPYRAIFLTDEGEKLAEESRRRHEIVLGFLKKAGVSPETAEADAEGIEHHVSPETLDVLRKLTRRLEEMGK